MNDQQARSRRAYDDAAKLRKQTIADTSRVIKRERDREANANRLRGRNSGGKSVSGNRSGAAITFLLVFMVVGVIAIILFVLFVLFVVLSNQR